MHAIDPNEPSITYSYTQDRWIIKGGGITRRVVYRKGTMQIPGDKITTTGIAITTRQLRLIVTDAVHEIAQRLAYFEHEETFKEPHE